MTPTPEALAAGIVRSLYWNQDGTLNRVGSEEMILGRVALALAEQAREIERLQALLIDALDLLPDPTNVNPVTGRRIAEVRARAAAQGRAG